MKQAVDNFYITTTLPYVNAPPHIGFALELIQADAVARFHRLCGEMVIFNTGTDEHGVKIYQKALEEGKEPQAYCNLYAQKFHALKEALNVSYTNFIRTTDVAHKKAAQGFWKRCMEHGDIYKRKYQIKYCIGCEMEKTDSELEHGACPIHPNLRIELIDEENYFFRFSKFQGALLDWYKNNPDFVLPHHRQEEITKFVERGLEDFSISRLKEKMPWGVPVPGDDAHVMYVWFDALVNYISTLGWPATDKSDTFSQFWPGVQIAGKDNLRQQAAMWQAMLLSVQLPPSKQIFIHGFITAGGQKMSKSLGNVVNPLALVETYGTDALRYFLLGGIPSDEDGDFTLDRFEEYYTAHLVNGIGNLNSRIMTMLEKYSAGKIPAHRASDEFDTAAFWKKYEHNMNEYKFDLIIQAVNELVVACDTAISTRKPWEAAKRGEDVSEPLFLLVETLRHIGIALLPLIPGTAEKILAQFGTPATVAFKEEREWGRVKKGAILTKASILFPRLGKEQK